MKKYLLITLSTLLLLGICPTANAQGSFVSVNVSIPGTLADELYARSAGDIDQLTVRGMIDDRDLMTIRRLLFVKYLDLSQTDLRSVPSNAFASMRNLTTIILPNGIRRIGRSAFENCLMLAEFRVTDKVTEIAPSSFYNCKMLQIIEIPSSVEKIGQEAFMSCTELDEVIIDGQTSIGVRAFAGCSALRAVICRSYTPPEVELSAFEGTPLQKIVAVPANAIEEYRAHKGWGRLFAEILPIDER